MRPDSRELFRTGPEFSGDSREFPCSKKGLYCRRYRRLYLSIQSLQDTAVAMSRVRLWVILFHVFGRASIGVGAEA